MAKREIWVGVLEPNAGRAEDKISVVVTNKRELEEAIEQLTIFIMQDFQEATDKEFANAKAHSV